MNRSVFVETIHAVNLGGEGMNFTTFETRLGVTNVRQFDSTDYASVNAITITVLVSVFTVTVGSAEEDKLAAIRQLKLVLRVVKRNQVANFVPNVVEDVTKIANPEVNGSGSGGHFVFHHKYSIHQNGSIRTGENRTVRFG